MPRVCGVRFRGAGKVYYFAPSDQDALEVDDAVIVETARGLEMGWVVFAEREVPKGDIVGELKPVLRRARTDELLDAQRFEHKEPAAVTSCQERVTQMGLPMKIVGAEYSYDGSRLTFFFVAEQRVDFRDLVRDLARSFHTRIDLRQVGVRDQAKLIGGMGKCGRALCCATWLTGFSPVSIRMAKTQNLPLSPSEISGQCGRLLCCLRYEDDLYRAVLKEFPKEGKTLETELGPARVVRVDVLNEEALVRLEDGTMLTLSAAQIRGEEPITPPSMNGLAEEQRRLLESALGGARSADSPQSDGQTRRRERGNASVGEQVSGGEVAKDSDSKSRRSRRRPRRRRSQGTDERDGDAPQDLSASSDDDQPQRQRRRRPRRPRKRRGQE